MHWKKMGHIFTTNGQKEWMNSHASVPIADHISDDKFRVYFSTRDKSQRSHIASIEIDIRNPENILGISDKPHLGPGLLGTFDDSGTIGSWLTYINGNRFMYYIGWNIGVTVPFRNSVGLAVQKVTDEFDRYCPGPIVDRNMFEPHFVASVCVLEDEPLWKMWYTSCTHWEQTQKGPLHHYHIKYATSQDGINWQRDGTIAIDHSNSNEYAIARPCVVKTADKWEMWYSYRGDSYRIGYAWSSNGINWIRQDDLAGIDVSSKGWDSQMIEYPYVFDHKGQRYMLYNGNGYGETGFGLAILEHDND